MRRALSFIALAGCLGPQDDPSQVRDLRVVAAQFDPPEIMASSCAGLIGSGNISLDGGFDGGIPGLGGGLQNLAQFAPFIQPISLKWLVLDPQQREFDYELRACASTNDLECNDDGGFVSIETGTHTPGTLTVETGGLDALALQFLKGSLGGLLDGGSDGGDLPLLLEVINRDPYKGLGGFRMPLVLHVTAGTEQVFAQKLMVFSCRMFPEQQVNTQPIIPGLSVGDAAWPQSTDGGPTLELSLGTGEVKMTPDDFGALEEDYIVPALNLEPVHLHESWKFSWHASMGRFNPTTSGGTDFTGMVNKPYSRWLPRMDGGVAGLVETDVDFWIVVRDGRGGESWIERRAHFVP